MSVNKSLITNTIKPVSDEEKQMAKSKGERDKRIERYLEALTTLSKRDPDAFESMAPDLIRKSVWNIRGSDPYFSSKLYRWLESDCMWTKFDEILPREELKSSTKLGAFTKMNLPKQYIPFLENLEERFIGDFNRWDASTRDQFIILGMVAMGGKIGEKQGRIIRSLGLSNGTDLQGSNAIRAAKIALTKYAKPMKLFDKATGNGMERLHKFNDANLADIVVRFVNSHPAALLLPPPSILMT